MFTGLVEAAAVVKSLELQASGARLWLSDVPFVAELQLGESVAVNGCCLTVVECNLDQKSVRFDLLAETLRVTSLNQVSAGSKVNLERAMRAGDRMGGHYVQGHVDATAEVLDFSAHGDDFRFEIALPPAFRSFIIHRGSICVDGISLTVAELGVASFTCWIIPHTREVTNLSQAMCGKRVNLEFDVLAKYVQRAIEVSRSH